MTGSRSTSTRVLQWFVRGGTLTLKGGQPFEIGVDPVIVGRDGGASVVLSDKEVSALHCELRATGEGIVLRDLGSTNGTFIGKTKIREAVIGETTEVLIGQERLLITPRSSKERVELAFVEQFGEIVGQSPVMRRIFGVLEKVAKSDLSILILGETGTGKEVVARSVHAQSPRASGPFVVVDCGSIPETLAESLLFGHEKGAFTGAHERRKGALLEAHKGTLFLDELGELPIETQPKLLRALAERQVRRVGSSQLEPVDVRVLAATRRDLGKEMNAGRFRSDLFFRIAQVRLEMPPLRDRLSDLPNLVETICARSGQGASASAVIDWLTRRMPNHDWPGNVRELVNVVQVAATLADSPEAIDEVLSISKPNFEEQSGPLTAFSEAKKIAVAAFERQYFSELSKKAGGNISEMARASGMERHHVRAFLKKHGIEKGTS